jgi:hypothetical protein
MWGSEWPLIAEIKRSILAGGLAKPFLRIDVESALRDLNLESVLSRVRLA